jgi:pyruvate dehydrogenase E1 component
VPILVDEARTFGMEGLFRQIGIYNPEGQKYTPVDKDQVMYYREDKAGQILQEGINEAGGMASWIAAATSLFDQQPHHGAVLHLLLDVRLPAHRRPGLGGRRHAGARLPAGRHLRAAPRSTAKACSTKTATATSWRAPSPTASATTPPSRTKWRVILQHGLKRMVEKQDNVFYYLTLLNENYPMPGLRRAPKSRSSRACTCWKDGARRQKGLQREPAGQRHHPARVHGRQGVAGKGLGRGGQRLELPQLQRADPRRPGLRALEPAAPHGNARVPFVTQQLENSAGPVIASTDYMKAYAEQIRAYMPKGRSYKVLGTDGFGRSDFRSKLREHFEINRHYIVVAALKALADEGHRASDQGGRGDPEVRHRRRQGEPAVRLSARRA